MHRVGDYRETGCFPDAVDRQGGCSRMGSGCKGMLNMRVSVAVPLKIVEVSGTQSAGQVPEP